MVSMHFQAVVQYPVMPFQYPHCPAFSLLHPVFKTSEPLIVALTGSSEAFWFVFDSARGFSLQCLFRIARCAGGG